MRQLFSMILVCGFATGASAQFLIWDNGPNAGEAMSSQRSEGLEPFESQLADDFNLPTGPGGEIQWLITEVGWAGDYYNPPFVNPPPDDFNIFIYNDAGGLPTMPPTGSAIYSYTATFGEVNQTPEPPGLGYSYNLTLPTPFLVHASTQYWIVIQSDMDFPPQWGWNRSGINTGSEAAFVSAYFGFPEWVPGREVFGDPRDASYQLWGDPVASNAFRLFLAREGVEGNTPLGGISPTLDNPVIDPAGGTERLYVWGQVLGSDPGQQYIAVGYNVVTTGSAAVVGHSSWNYTNAIPMSRWIAVDPGNLSGGQLMDVRLVARPSTDIGVRNENFFGFDLQYDPSTDATVIGYIDVAGEGEVFLQVGDLGIIRDGAGFDNVYLGFRDESSGLLGNSFNMSSPIPEATLGVGPPTPSTLVFPTTPHASQNLVPFGSGLTGMHQVLDADLFIGNLGGQPIARITDIAFSPGRTGTFNFGLVRVNLGYTTVEPGNLALPNAGTNPSGPMSSFFSERPYTVNITSAGTEEWSEMVMSGSFNYDPSLGNLLIEIVVSNPLFAFLDVSTTLGSAEGSRTFESSRLGNDPSNNSATRMQFTYLPVSACPCACDFDPDPACNIFDFLEFQNQFVAGEPCACDFDPDPACNIFDFLAFQNQFVGGCP